MSKVLIVSLCVLVVLVVFGVIFQQTGIFNTGTSSSILSSVPSLFRGVWGSVSNEQSVKVDAGKVARVSAASLSTDIQNLTQTLVNENDLYNQSPPMKTTARHDTMVSIATQRKQLMLNLLGQDPKEFLSVAMEDDQRSAFPQAVADKIEEEVVMQGDLKIYHEDLADRSVTTYTLIDPLNQEIKLSFSNQPNLVPRTIASVSVAGVKLDNNLASDGSKTNVRVVTRTSHTTGVQNILASLVNFQDNPTSRPYTVAQISSFLFAPTTDTAGLNAFFYENSLRQATLAGQVVGWFTLPYALGSTCNTGLMMREAVRAADPTVDFKNYTNVMVIFPRSNYCLFRGAANLVPLSIQTNDTLPGDLALRVLPTWLNEPSFLFRTAAHELGHNFGIHHAGALECGTKTLDTNPTVNCAFLEYADPLDVMGAAQMYHFNAAHKAQLSWYQAASVQTLQTEGTYMASIGPTETPGAEIKTVKILKETDRLGVQTWYYLENREAIGYDAGLSPSVTRGLVVTTANVLNVPTQMLDFTPNSRSSAVTLETLTSPDFADAPLAPGQVFSDPVAEVTIKHVSNSGSLLNAEITIGSASNRAPVVSQVTPSVGGSMVNAPVTFTATVNDLDGWKDIQHVHLLVHTSSKKIVNAPYVFYNQNNNKLFLRKDDDSGWVNSCAPGAAVLIENTTTKLDCALSSVSGTGNALSVRWALVFKAGAVKVKTKSLFVKVRDDADALTTWINAGTWLVGPNSNPAVGTIAPADGISKEGEAISLSVSATDPNGWENIKNLSLLINGTTALANGARVVFDANANQLKLYQNNGTSVAGTCTPGATALIENSQVVLSCGRSGTLGTGKSLTLTLRLIFMAGFVNQGAKNAYLSVRDDLDATVNWTKKGTWTVQPAP